VSTTTVKSIGTTARDYSTLQAWEDACPANLTTSISGGEIWKGECYNDSELASLLVSGTTTDATGYLWLTAASGESFIDHADVATNPIAYDVSKGAGLKKTTVFYVNSGRMIAVEDDYTIIERLQIHNAATDTHYGANATVDILVNQPNVIIKDCIIAAARGGVTLRTSNLVNCVFYNTSDSYSPGVSAMESYGNSGTIIGCTIARPDNFTAGGTGINHYLGTSAHVENTAVFGFATACTGTFDASSDYNASDDTTTPGANSVDSLTFANQFVGVDSTGTLDWRIKAGASLITAGVYNATYPYDLLGTARDASTPDIGATEFVSGGAVLIVADTAHGHSAESPALTQANVLVVQDAAHSHTVDSPTLDFSAILVVQDALHTQLVDALDLVQAGLLAVSDTVHGHMAESPNLIQANVLAIADTQHGHLVDAVVLDTAGAILDVQAALHAQQADNVALTQANTLIVSDALHAQLVDVVALLTGQVITPASRIYVVSKENRIYVVEAESRTLVIH